MQGCRRGRILYDPAPRLLRNGQVGTRERAGVTVYLNTRAYRRSTLLFWDNACRWTGSQRFKLFVNIIGLQKYDMNPTPHNINTYAK